MRPLAPSPVRPRNRLRPHDQGSRDTNARRWARPDGGYTGLPESSSLTESFSRPFLRRRLMISRPSFVFMRSRKPCFFLRFLSLGWYVRFGMAAVRLV